VTTALTFADTARILSRASRTAGVAVPGFRSPPRDGAVDRTVAGRGDGAMVAVRLRGRPWPAVAADMVDGVVVVNELSGGAASRLRDTLWQALWDELADMVGPARRSTVVTFSPPRASAA
jgi:hypothetical protein